MSVASPPKFSRVVEKQSEGLEPVTPPPPRLLTVLIDPQTGGPELPSLAGGRNLDFDQNHRRSICSQDGRMDSHPGLRALKSAKHGGATIVGDPNHQVTDRLVSGSLSHPTVTVPLVPARWSQERVHGAEEEQVGRGPGDWASADLRTQSAPVVQKLIKLRERFAVVGRTWQPSHSRQSPSRSSGTAQHPVPFAWRIISDWAPFPSEGDRADINQLRIDFGALSWAAVGGTTGDWGSIE